MTKKDPLPTAQKFCFYFSLKPAVAVYILVEYIVWILFLLSALNLEIDCLEKTDLVDFENVLRRDLYYYLVFGEVDAIPHENARCKLISFGLHNKLQFSNFIFSPCSVCDISQHNFGPCVSSIFCIHAVSAGRNSKGKFVQVLTFSLT